MNELPAHVETLISELNAGDVGHEVFPEGVLRYEGFSDQCWEAHVERFGEDEAAEGVQIVEQEMHEQWLKSHPGMQVTASNWEGGCEPWDDCVHWAWLTMLPTEGKLKCES